MNNNAMMIKTKSLFGKRLKSSDYQVLLQKKDISEVAAFLKNETYFKKTLDGINEKSIHRGQLENLIRMDVFRRYPKILKYSTANDGDFYDFIVIFHEITQILNTVRGFISEDKTELIAMMPMFIGEHTKFDMKKLVDVHTFDELLEVIKNTPYFNVVEKYKKVKIEDIDFVGLEYSLTSLYYEEILRLSRKNFKGQELKAIEDIILTGIELDNLTKIYRLKKYFKASPAVIKSYLIPIYKYFNKQSLFEIIDNCSGEEVISKLKSSKYLYYMGDFKTDRFEYYVKKIKYEISKHYMYFSSESEVVLLAYFVLCEIEIQNIIDIIEGARYKVPLEQVSRLLIY